MQVPRVFETESPYYFKLYSYVVALKVRKVYNSSHKISICVIKVKADLKFRRGHCESWLSKGPEVA